MSSSVSRRKALKCLLFVCTLVTVVRARSRTRLKRSHLFSAGELQKLWSTMFDPEEVQARLAEIEGLSEAMVTTGPTTPPSGSNFDNLVFKDVTAAAGIRQDKRLKYGGPAVADLDGDGLYDLVLTYHTSGSPEIFFAEGDGTFTKGDFRKMADIHGIAIAPRTAKSLDKLIVFSLGGSNGKKLKQPTVVLSTSTRSLMRMNKDLGITTSLTNARGRISMFMDLSLGSKREKRTQLGGPDLLFANFLGKGELSADGPKQYALRNRKGLFEFETVPGFELEPQGCAELTDVDGDQVMEIISYQEFRIYKLIAPFTFVDATSTIAPGIAIEDYTVIAACEFDMDNDGDFDLYLARGFEKLASNSRVKGREVKFNDILLENRNGVYVDVSRKAKITGKTFSMGVSAEDFNNDGYVDLIVTQNKKRDIILMNNGDGTFSKISAQIPKTGSTRSDNTIAVDYDGDGRVDMITGQGLRSEATGRFLLMKNMMPLTDQNRYLLVRVGNDPSGSCTALHALVTIEIGSGKMVRRVGGRGSQKAGPGSFIDTVHFGVAKATKVERVSVRWTCGTAKSKSNVSTNAKISFGTF